MRIVLLALAALALAGCQPPTVDKDAAVGAPEPVMPADAPPQEEAPPEAAAPPAVSATPAPAAPTPVRTEPRPQGTAPLQGCAGEIGQDKAERLVKRCIAVSPATRPPCNVANPCELIRGEIERSCAQYGSGETRPAECSA